MLRSLAITKGVGEKIGYGFRFDIFYTLKDLRKIVLRKADGPSHDEASGQRDGSRRGAVGTKVATLPCKE